MKFSFNLLFSLLFVSILNFDAEAQKDITLVSVTMPDTVSFTDTWSFTIKAKNNGSGNPYVYAYYYFSSSPGIDYSISPSYSGAKMRYRNLGRISVGSQKSISISQTPSYYFAQSGDYYLNVLVKEAYDHDTENFDDNIVSMKFHYQSYTTCYDGIQNNDETGIDCGGSCPDACGSQPPQGDGGTGESLWTAGTNSIYDLDSNIGIGTSDPASKLSVIGNVGIEGNVKAIDFTATPNIWPDYVFSDTYELPSLEQVEQYIEKNKHLPGVPSESEVLENGNNLSETNVILLEKIEELTLHLIEMNKKIKELEAKIKE